jgi:hypothetical protein
MELKFDTHHLELVLVKGIKLGVFQKKKQELE